MPDGTPRTLVVLGRFLVLVRPARRGPPSHRGSFQFLDSIAEFALLQAQLVD